MFGAAGEGGVFGLPADALDCWAPQGRAGKGPRCGMRVLRAGEPRALHACALACARASCLARLRALAPPSPVVLGVLGATAPGQGTTAAEQGIHCTPRGVCGGVVN